MKYMGISFVTSGCMNSFATMYLYQQCNGTDYRHSIFKRQWTL